MIPAKLNFGCARRDGALFLFPRSGGRGCLRRIFVGRTVSEFGQIDTLVNNAAFQIERSPLADAGEEEWDKTFDINAGLAFQLPRLAAPHMPRGFG